MGMDEIMATWLTNVEYKSQKGVPDTMSRYLENKYPKRIANMVYAPLFDLGIVQVEY